MKNDRNNKLSKEIIDAWFCNKSIPGIMYNLNDSIEVVEGNYKGKIGTVITLLSYIDEIIFLIEFENGEEAQIPQINLKLLED